MVARRNVTLSADKEDWETPDDIPGWVLHPEASFSGNERNHFFLNLKGKQFADISAVSGLDLPQDSRRFVIWDFNRDGRQDVAVVNANAPRLTLHRNEIETDGNLIAVRLIGGNSSPERSAEWSARDAYGAKVTVESGETSIVREHRCGDGFGAQNSTTIIIGMSHLDPSRVVVTWPSGKTTAVEAPRVGDLITVFENPADCAGSESYLAEPYTASLPIHSQSVGQVKENGNALGDGRIRLVAIMASWCPACKRHLPHLRRLSEQIGTEHLAVHCVPVTDEEDIVEFGTFISENLPAAVLPEPPFEAEIRREMVGRLPGGTIPAYLIFDAAGQVLEADLGIPTLSRLREVTTENGDNLPLNEC